VGSSKSKKKTTSTYTPPAWVEDASRQAIGIGRSIGNQQFRAFGGERVAGLSENERMGMQMARDSVGVGDPYFDKSAMYADRGAQSWTDADQSKFINPYIKGALDPAAREIREQGQRALTDVTDRAASMDAFSGRRSQLAQADIQEKTMQELGDMYGEGYARAYEWGAQMFGQERARDMEAAGRFAQLGGLKIDAAQTDISTLMTTGATDRSIQQAMRDFDWQQFVEERDWGFRQLMGVVSALEGSKGSYSTTQTTKEVVKKDNTAEVVGAIAQIVSAAYAGGSDARLKTNITYIGTYMGRKLYAWTWKPIAYALGLAGPNIGIIAQENPDVSMRGLHGFLMVNYRAAFGDK
jgi:hypothetical protein